MIGQLWREFSGLGPLESHVIDNAEMTPAETALELRRRVEDGSLTV